MKYHLYKITLIHKGTLLGTDFKIEPPMIYFCLKNDIDWKFVGRVSVPSSFAALFELKAEVIL